MMISYVTSCFSFVFAFWIPWIIYFRSMRYTYPLTRRFFSTNGSVR